MKHNNRPKKEVPEAVKESAREHIRSFPTIDSHYCRSNSNRKYLEEGLSLKEMYRMYKKFMTENQKTPVVSQYMYSTIFNTEFNYGYFVPKKDRYEI